jgi:hypothetical protein
MSIQFVDASKSLFHEINFITEWSQWLMRSWFQWLISKIFRLIRGRCYDHNFLRFPPIFGKKWRFSKIPMFWSTFFQNLALFWVKNANFFAKFFGENILKNHNIGPWKWVKKLAPNSIKRAKKNLIDFLGVSINKQTYYNAPFLA